MAFEAKNLDDFLTQYGDILAQKARKQLDPLHVPGRDPAVMSRLLRKPFDAQAHVVTAAVKLWRRSKALQLVAEMGSGKTFMAMAAVQGHADGRPAVKTGPMPDVDEWVHLDYGKNVLHANLTPTPLVHGDDAKKVKTFRHTDGSTYYVQGNAAMGVVGATRGWWGTWQGYELAPADRGEERRTVMAGKKEYAVVRPVTFGTECKRVYRALVVCPGQLTEKWKREIEGTVPNARVTIIEDYRDLLPLVARSRRYREAVNQMKADNREIAEVRRAKRGLKKVPYAQELRLAAYLHLKERAEGDDPAGRPDNQVFANGDGRDRDSIGRTRGLLPECPEFFIIGRDRLKLSSTWTPSYRRRAVPIRDEDGDQVGRRWKVGGEATRDEQCSRCPGCGDVLCNKDGELLEEKHLKSNRRSCKYVLKREAGGQLVAADGCGEQLWQDVAKPKRYSPAKIIQKKLKGFFDYLIVDEAHEYKGTDSVQADAIGAVASACKKVAALTGTLVGGYAWHVRTLLFRIGAGGSMVGDGFGWKDEKAWNEKYGRIETKITSDGGDDDGKGKAHKFAKGEEKKKTQSYVRPGIVPTMFKHLIGNSIFLALDEVAANLPPLLEDVVEVELDHEQRPAYEMVDEALMAAIKDMVRRGNKKLLGTMLNCLLCYPDYPFDWGTIGYYDNTPEGGGGFVPVVNPPNLDPLVLRPKEQALIERVLQEKNEGRQVWIYCQYTDKRDCIARVRGALENQGLKVKVMRASVSPAEREEWINTHGNGADVIVSHPDLVKTGLDFFNRAAGHNYTTIMFYQTGYNLFTLRQAARRAWRIGQRRECRVLYFYFKGTMQERAMSLMGRKLSAANALEGKFSAEGLAAMAGDDENMEMALAKSLADGIKEEGASRAWAKLTTSLAPSARFAPSANAEPLEDFLHGFAAEMAALGVMV
jgi:hypothetical protein